MILSSEAYKTMQACKNGIESTRKNSQASERFETKNVATGHKFNLKATNGQVIGTSEVYNSLSGMNNGISSVMKNAPEAPILDLS
ncbi:YegP family protein [Christiangramia echinicola]|uniref:YegP family protein n=1 Tax=Christiangramia echinicola TaxID=279359 RepID=UPI00311A9E14